MVFGDNLSSFVDVKWLATNRMREEMSDVCVLPFDILFASCVDILFVSSIEAKSTHYFNTTTTHIHSNVYLAVANPHCATAICRRACHNGNYLRLKQSQSNKATSERAN